MQDGANSQRTNWRIRGPRREAFSESLCVELVATEAFDRVVRVLHSSGSVPSGL